MTHREAPEIRWRAVLAGGAVAVGTALLLFSALPTGVSTVAGFAAVAAGAFLAGRLAPLSAGLHGGLVAAFWIAAEALADPVFAAPADLVGDTALTIALDVGRIAVGIASGWAGARLR